MRTPIPVEERFWPKVDASGNCWLWKGAKDQDGYGLLRLGGAALPMVRATHVAWLLQHGQLPAAGLHVCHSCDNPPCVRIDHLFIGTPADNYRDMASKGRRATNPKASWTHCSHGHEFTEQNTIHRGRMRQCRECKNTQARERRQRSAGVEYPFLVLAKDVAR